MTASIKKIFWGKSISALLLAAALSASGCASKSAKERASALGKLDASTPGELVLPPGVSREEVLDQFQLPAVKEVENGYEKVGRPRQFLSVAEKSQVRLHRLGALNWVYVMARPSSIWPLVLDFWKSKKIKLVEANPSAGIIRTAPVAAARGGKRRFWEMRLEHGIRQQSSEVFLAVFEQGAGSSLREVTSEVEEVRSYYMDLMRFLSDNSDRMSGHSLVAGALDQRQKATLIEDDGERAIVLLVGFNRSWSAAERALQSAEVPIYDKNRKDGLLYVFFDEKLARRQIQKNKRPRRSAGPPAGELGQVERVKAGLSGDKKKKKNLPNMIVQVKPSDYQTLILVLAEPDAKEQAAKLLDLIKFYLS